MAIVPLTNAKIYVAQYDLSGDHNQLNLSIGHKDKVCTVFGDAAEKVKGGLGFFDASGEGFAQFGSTGVHSILRSQLNVADVAVTIAPMGADGDYAEFTKAQVVTYTPGMTVGEFASFTFAAKSQGDLSVAGTIMGTGSKTVTAQGTGRNLGTVGATQSLYAALHVLSVSGTNPTLDVIVNSDDHSGFTSETLRGTFTQKTAAGWQYLTPIAGPITDNWFRVGWTIGGTGTPTFSIVVVLGIANDARA